MPHPILSLYLNLPQHPHLGLGRDEVCPNTCVGNLSLCVFGSDIYCSKQYQNTVSNREKSCIVWITHTVTVSTDSKPWTGPLFPGWVGEWEREWVKDKEECISFYLSFTLFSPPTSRPGPTVCDCERISTQVPRLLLSVGSFVKPEVSECIASVESVSLVKQLTLLSSGLLGRAAVSLF